MATQNNTSTQRSARAKSSTASRRRTTAKSSRTQARRTTQTAARQTAKAEAKGLEAVAQQAQRVVLVPVGAALVAGENLTETVKLYTKRTSAERELKKFERRGERARTRVQREVKKTRTRVERELRQRRTQAVRLAKRNRRQVETTLRRTRRDFDKRGNDIQAGAENLVQGVRDGVTSLV